MKGRRILFVLLCCSIFTNTHALDIPWETLSGSKASGRFGWDYSYDIGFYSDTLMVDLDVQLIGATVEPSLLNRWEYGIENIWSTNRFDVPILFNVDWVSDIYDQTVTVHPGQSDRTPGRTYNMTNWFLEGAEGWGDQYQEEVTAHEAGHMFGLWDEYEGGAVDPITGLINTRGLMHTLDNAPTPGQDHYKFKIKELNQF